MYLTVENRSNNIIKILLKKNKNDPKAKIDIKCNNWLQQRTALHIAAASRHYSILNLLACKDDRGLNWKDFDHKTALELVATNGYKLVIIKLVQAFGKKNGLVSKAFVSEKESEIKRMQ